jgi:hypothetical protein
MPFHSARNPRHARRSGHQRTPESEPESAQDGQKRREMHQGIDFPVDKL